MSARNPDKVMSILGHIMEVRRRLIASISVLFVCFILVMVFYDETVRLFIDQFGRIESILGAKLFSNSITEGFLVQIRTSAIVAVMVSLPFHLVNIAQFLFPALPPKSRKIITAGLVGSFFLAMLGAFIAYFQIIPFSIRFLAGSLYIPEDVGVMLNYQKSISYILTFMLWAVITFQTPLVLVILLALNILKRSAVLRSSRYVIIVIFVVAAMVTPSVDPVSQCAIALPLIILYFSVILIAKIFKLGEGGNDPGEKGRAGC
jgi:sec-independent protein translocase protein TatC